MNLEYLYDIMENIDKKYTTRKYSCLKASCKTGDSVTRYLKG